MPALIAKLEQNGLGRKDRSAPLRDTVKIKSREVGMSSLDRCTNLTVVSASAVSPISRVNATFLQTFLHGILCKGVQIPLVRQSHWHHEPHSWKHQEEEDFAPTEQDYHCNNPHHSLISLGLCGHYVRSSASRSMWLVALPRESGIV